MNLGSELKNKGLDHDGALDIPSCYPRDGMTTLRVVFALIGWKLAGALSILLARGKAPGPIDHGAVERQEAFRVDRVTLKKSLVGVVLLGAIALRFVLSNVAPIQGDSHRFLSMAEDLSRGAEEAMPGNLATSMPPGYPLFLRMIMALGGPTRAIIAVQFALSVLSCWLVYRAILPFGRRLALTGLCLMSFNPWIARTPAMIMSETLGTFLMALMVLLVSAMTRGQGRRAWLGCATGAVSVALVLTSPSTMFVALGIFALSCWTVRHQARLIGALVTGFLLLWLPWQAYCVAVNGHIEPFFLSPHSIQHTGLQQWLRSWSIWPEVGVWWNHRNWECLPDYAFRSEAEKSLLTRLDLTRVTAVFRYEIGSPYDRELQRVAHERFQENPFASRVVLPILRSATLWTEYPSLPHVSFPLVIRALRGWGCADVRDSIALSFLFLVIHFVITWPLLILPVFFFRRRLDIAVLFLGILLYTFAIGLLGLGEVRRNYPFYPALVFFLSGLGAVSRRKLADARDGEYRSVLSVALREPQNQPNRENH